MNSFKSYKKKLKAFSLAEVLIALAVIGVVAALTIPTLIKNIEDREFKSLLKKDYATLLQAQLALISDNGNFPNAIASCGDNACVVNAFKQKLSYVKQCTTLSECIPYTTATYMNGDDASSDSYFQNATDGLILNNGASVMIYLDDPTCSVNLSDSPTYSNRNDDCGWMILDVNALKGPNRFGRDIYLFRYFSNTILPTRDDEWFLCNHNDPGDYGLGCSYTYLTDNQ